MPRVVLITPTTTYRANDFLEAARVLRVEVVTASERPQALAAQMGDAFVRIDLRRLDWSVDRIVAVTEDRPVDAVIAVDDRGVVLAAKAAQKMGLPHNPPGAATATKDKAAMRRALAIANVPQPAFRTLVADADPHVASSGLGWPVVVKPISLSGSRGVIRADDSESLTAAVDRARRIATDATGDEEPTLLVEEYIAGREFALEALLNDGDLEPLALFDKPDPMEGPYFEETLLVTPARLAASTRQRLELVASQATAALGLCHGPIHAEFRVGNDDVRVLEVAARSIGGLCGRSLQFGMLGASLETLILRHALGYPSVVLDPKSPATGVMMLPIPGPGVLHAVDGQKQALATDGVVDLEITVPIGQRVLALPEGDRYLGFLFARGQDSDEVEESLRKGFAELRIVIH